MNSIRPIARAILPYQFRVSLTSVRKELEWIHRPVAFWQAFAEFRRLRCYDNVDRRLLKRLTYGWGNRYSAHVEYMAAYLHHASQTAGPILECGSGLSTLLLGIVAARNGNQVWSLEHDPQWGDKVKGQLRRWKIDSVRLNIDDLQSYAGFDWYTLPAVEMPQAFALVICDGPPGETRGGRYGLLPTMADRLDAQCTILLDDCERAGEQEVVRRWRWENPCSVEMHGTSQRYSVIALHTL